MENGLKLPDQNKRKLLLAGVTGMGLMGLQGCSSLTTVDSLVDTSPPDQKNLLVKGKAELAEIVEAVSERAETLTDAVTTHVKGHFFDFEREQNRKLPLDRFDYRYITMVNNHTGESIKSVYWENGMYDLDTLSQVNKIMRDHRGDEVVMMDPQLLDLMFLLHIKTQSKKPFRLVSAYRSPKSNEALRRQGIRAARNSLHMKGMATDLYSEEISLSRLRLAALANQFGGVGYYPSSNFIHIDTGRTRRW